MATSKYANLPDVDIAAADIFETEDLTYTAGANQDAYDSDDSLTKLNLLSAASGSGKRGLSERKAGENIDDSSLPPRKDVGKVFGKRGRSVVDKNSLYTFRPRRNHIRNGLDTSSSSDSEENGPSDGVAKHRGGRYQEDPVNKLRRLKLECLELQRQLETKVDEGQAGEPTDGDVGKDKVESGGRADGRRRPKAKPDTQAMLVQLLELRTGLETTEQSTALQRTTPIIDSKKMRDREASSKTLLSELGTKREAPAMSNGSEHSLQPDTKVDHDDLESVSEMDKRLDALEKRIGAGIDHASTPVPILSSLSRMEAILNMLSQPDELETASRRVKIVLADLDKAFTPSSKTAGLAGARGAVKEDNSLKLNPTDAQKVDALYACLPRIEPLMPLVPPLLTRLRSLATLHAGASAFQSTLSTLETDADNMKETDIEVKEVLDRLDEGITKQAQVMKANWGSLSERLQQLNERVVRLQT